ncbi:MAG TPA: hypothetical protein VGB25_05865 [Candidatus Binatia bacterium]
MEYEGVLAPANEPVLALVAEDDPWYEDSAWTGGDCSEYLDPANGSKSIVFRDGQLSHRHALLENKQVQKIVLQFLNEHKR